ncbi:hypothetical protein SAMN02745157_2534 [Kaistia soli DSM 19436]|uniref:Uncharacterized protein n=1 Tax=Kaistia soli DSM 19436 TaxID=1122133 RepID=A0A1M5D1N7_9HYPH|nr:hypothetical protein [Kaistia soli]SHF60928.1 hypothetical protein SAMN02745157_2534 [Kaistia soli DSM 19436]
MRLFLRQATAMRIPPGFRELCSGLHQDALYLAQGSVERLAANCISFVRQEHRADLREFLRIELAVRTASELKGVIKRQKPDIFFSSSAARTFLENVYQRLD